MASLEQPKTLFPDKWRQLGELIWSDLSLVQMMTVRILTYLADQKNVSWCREIIDEAYLDEEILSAAAEALLK